MDDFYRCKGFIHTVQEGETLYRIGQKYQVRVSALLYANPYAEIYHLQQGDQLCIPKLRPLS